MKKLFLTFFSVLTLTAHAQTTLHIFSNGNRVVYDVSRIDSMVFVTTEADKPGDGTLENPYSCKEALELVSKMAAGVESSGNIYIKGKVVSIADQFGTQFGNATFYISDDGTMVNQFLCYRVLYLENKKYSGIGRLLAVGDEVVVCGRVVNYRGNTPETAAQKAYLYMHNGQTTVNEGNNENANEAWKTPVLGRLEFPKVKGGNSQVFVHTTDDAFAGGVNYAFEWDYEKKSTRWVCYQMAKGYQGSAGRYNEFMEDPDLAVSQRLSDTYSYYKGSGFSRGHICPSADRQYSEEANKQTFYYTNIQPQYYNFNAGDNNDSPWCRLENQIRIWTRQSSTDTLYVVKGGTIEDGQLITTIKSGLRVPKYFFVALLLKGIQGYKAIGFWMEQDNENHGSDTLAQYALSIQDLEEKTGIDFFCNLPDEVEQRVETLSLESLKTAWNLD